MAVGKVAKRPKMLEINPSGQSRPAKEIGGGNSAPAAKVHIQAKAQAEDNKNLTFAESTA